MNPYFETLEFPAILTQLKTLAVSDAAAQQLAQMEPALNEQTCALRMMETTAARRVLDAFGAPPLPMMSLLEETVKQAEIGEMLSPEQLNGVAVFAASCKRMTGYLGRIASQDATLASYGQCDPPAGRPAIGKSGAVFWKMKSAMRPARCCATCGVKR